MSHSEPDPEPEKPPAYTPPYPFASLKTRCLAGLIDLALTLVVVVACALVLSNGGVIIGVLLVIAAFAYLEARSGKTPGKAVMGIRVRQLDGAPCTTLAAIVRNAFRVIDGFPGIYLIALTSVAGSKRRQRLGDQAAGTSVFDDRDRIAEDASSFPATSTTHREHMSTTTTATEHRRLLDWLSGWQRVLNPDGVVWCDGSEDGRRALADELVRAGTFSALDPELRPDSFLARSDPRDVARVEDRTYIASDSDPGPTNNWREPAELRAELLERYRGAMRGRTMYIIPFSMGPLGAPSARIGVQLTDSAYAALSMTIMTRVEGALEALGADGEFVPCIHSIGAPLEPGEDDVPWPCNPEQTAIAHFPESREIWSYGSGYGGNALLGKKCLALRIASVIAREEGWLAEHMLILKLTSPTGAVRYIAGAFPSACGKTNLAMLVPAIPGWAVETIGDDIAWMRFGDDGRLYAINPEAGFFGVAPGTGCSTNPTAMRTIERSTIFTNAAHTLVGDVWWEGMTDEPPAQATDWLGEPWTPASDEPAAHLNARFTVPAAQCPSMAPEWQDPAGVPISAFLFGGRRARTVPLVSEARSWAHGVFLGATMASETTAAAAGAVGELRRDPFAMLPFCGYHMGDYMAHWLALGERPDAVLPRIFQVNWFRRNEDGRFLWPGFGENARVLAWIHGRCEGTATAVDTPIGLVPGADALDLSGLDLAPADLAELLRVDGDAWRAELPLIEEHLAQFGDRLPAALGAELQELRTRLS
jgi:phosphoenolpyruvate carboxykinase (GTP)